MRNKLLKIMLNILNAKISLPTYLWVLSSLVIAVYVIWNIDLVRVTPFAQKLPVDAAVWSISLALGDTLCLIGMMIRHPRIPIVRYAAFLSFLCWLFGNLSFLLTGGWLIVVWVTGWYNLMYAYLFLAASLGMFKRKNLPQ